MSRAEKDLLKHKVFLMSLPLIGAGLGTLIMYYLIVFKL